MLRYLGIWWKFWQRAVYVVAIATVIHWVLIKWDVVPVVIHFAPLAALEAYRLWHNFMKTGRPHPQV
jgi:sulfoxide reductase heme-binding subunit YedZ